MKPWKCNISGFFCSIYLKFCRLLKLSKKIHLISNFLALAFTIRIISLCSKTKDYCFLTIRKVFRKFFFKNMLLCAVIIQLHLFQIIFCLNNRPFVFSVIDDCVDFGCHGIEIWNQAKFLCQILTACKISNKSNKRLLKYRNLMFSLSCRIASVTSYLCENEAKNF